MPSCPLGKCESLIPFSVAFTYDIIYTSMIRLIQFVLALSICVPISFCFSSQIILCKIKKNIQSPKTLSLICQLPISKLHYFADVLHNGVYSPEDAVQFDKCIQLLFTLYKLLSTALS